MVFRRSNSSRGRSYRRPSMSGFAKKQRLWLYTSISVADTPGSPTQISLVVGAQWVRNATTGNVERCKAVFQELVLRASTQATEDFYTGRYYTALAYADDTSDLTDPTQGAFWSAVGSQPYATGQLVTVPDNATVILGGQPVYAGNRDFVRKWRVNRNLTTGDRLWLVIEPATAAQAVTWTGFCRTLIEYQ